METRASRNLTWLLSGSPGKIDGSTVLRTEGVQNEIPFAKAQVGGPGGIRTHDLRLRRPPSWSWLDYQPGPGRPRRILYAYSCSENCARPRLCAGLLEFRLSSLWIECPLVLKKHLCSRCNTRSQLTR